MSDFYKKSALYLLLNQQMPSLKKIENELRVVEPSVITELIRNEPECVFILDYYFRLFDPAIGARIVGHPDLDLNALIEMFNCQVIRYYRAHLNLEDYGTAYYSLLESFWKDIGREKMLLLFQNLIKSGESNRLSAVMLLQNMDLGDLKFLQKSQSKGLLDFFKKIQNLDNFLVSNLDLYDYVYRLALDSDDVEYLRFLDEYTNLAVQLRIAHNFANEAEAHIDSEGKIVFKNLIELIQDVPVESQNLTLEILQRRGFITEQTVLGIRNLADGKSIS